jgi:hypothetical protein
LEYNGWTLEPKEVHGKISPGKTAHGLSGSSSRGDEDEGSRPSRAG